MIIIHGGEEDAFELEIELNWPVGQLFVGSINYFVNIYVRTIRVCAGLGAW